MSLPDCFDPMHAVALDPLAAAAAWRNHAPEARAL